MNLYEEANRYFEKISREQGAKVNEGLQRKNPRKLVSSRKGLREARDPLARIKKIDTRNYKLINKNSYDNVNTYEVKDGSLGKNVNQFDAWGANLYYDAEENNWWVMNNMIDPEDTASNTIAEAIKKAYDEFKDWDGDYEDAKVIGYAIDDHEIDYNAPADEDSEFNFYLIDLIHSYDEEEEDDDINLLHSYEVIVYYTDDETGKYTSNSPVTYGWNIDTETEAIKYAKSYLGRHTFTAGYKNVTVTKVQVIEHKRPTTKVPVVSTAVYEATLQEDGSISSRRINKPYNSTPWFIHVRDTYKE